MRGRAGERLLLARGRGVAAIEFALLFPVMIGMMLGVVDASRALIAYRRVTVAAETVAVIGTLLSVQPDGSTDLTPTQTVQAASAIYGVMPGLAASGAQFSVTLTGVLFSATATGFAANVAWSAAPLAGKSLGQDLTRTCGVLKQIDPTVTPDLSSIPTKGLAAPTSVLIADVSYVFTPLFTRVFIGPQTFRRSAFLPPRLGGPTQYITYDSANMMKYYKNNPGGKPPAPVCPTYL